MAEREEEFRIVKFFDVIDGEVYCFVTYDSVFTAYPHWQERIFYVEQFPYPEARGVITGRMRAL